MEWKHLRKSKSQNVQNFPEEFRKQAMNLSIPLDSPEIVTKYISSLYSYIGIHYYCMSLLLSMRPMWRPCILRAGVCMNKMTTKKEPQQPREEEKSPLLHIVRKRDTTKRIVGNCTMSLDLRGMTKRRGRRQFPPCNKITSLNQRRVRRS